MTHIYYKAVRTDGTDFRTGTVDYASLSLTGEKLPRLPGGNCCGPGVYHASDVPSETLVGGSWPCRLFAVTGKPVAQQGHKFGFRTLRVVGELEAWQALGPNGREVSAHIERIRECTPEQIDSLLAAWSAARDTAWSAAPGAARGAAWNAAWGAAWSAARDTAWSAVWDTARALVVRDLITALVVRDLITPEQFDILYGPWASVMNHE